ncbi:MAG: hypothetical protein JXX14_01465 [Deltaproteobacteria bacterium]|nr:hypothetical protein [Deltaproteobacteria bacterium]
MMPDRFNTTAAAQVMGDEMPTYIGNYPHKLRAHWSDNLQGVTHSDDHWFFTQLTKLLKFPVTSDLNAPKRPAGASVKKMPKELSEAGYNHFGDPDYLRIGAQGYIFIPVEGKDMDPILAVFKDGVDIEFVGHAVLPSQTCAKHIGRAGWVAFDANDLDHRLLHSSHNRISADYPVYRYKVDFDQLILGTVSLVAADTDLPLTHDDGTPVKIKGYIQGGCFSPDGRLFIISGKGGDDGKGGILAFSSSGDFLFRSVQNKTDSNSFVYRYDSGPLCNEEPEGITWWNVDGLHAPHITGQLHAILLNNNPGTDSIYLKHYRIPG